MQMKGNPSTALRAGVNINDDEGLEKEADEMGAKSNAFSLAQDSIKNSPGTEIENNLQPSSSTTDVVLQGMWVNGRWYDTRNSDPKNNSDDLYELLVNKYNLKHDEDGHCHQAFLELLSTEKTFNTPNELIDAIENRAAKIVLPGVDNPAADLIVACFWRVAAQKIVWSIRELTSPACRR